VASLNKVMLIGNAGKDAELRYTANGLATGSFSLAVNNRRRNPQTNEWEDQTEWFNVVLFAEMAERVSQYVTKGKPVYVEGRLQTRSWDNDAGVKQYRTEVIASSLQLLGSRDDGGRGEELGQRPAGQTPGQQAWRRERGQAKAAGVPAYDDIDDLPFG